MQGEVHGSRILPAFRPDILMALAADPQIHLHLVLLQCSMACGKALAIHAPSTCTAPVRSWNFFRCNINETLIREVADAMVANGLRDAGFQYVNIGGS